MSCAESRRPTATATSKPWDRTAGERFGKQRLRAARAEAMEVSDEKVDAAFARTRAMMGEEAFRDMLDERGVSQEGFRKFLRERERVEQYKQKLYATIEVDEETLREYFEGHSDAFVEPESARLEAFSVASEEQAQEIHRRWSGGEGFDALSEEFSERAGKKMGRRTRWMPLDAVPIELRQRVEKARAGDLLDPVFSSEQYYVAKVIERRGARVKDFEEAKEQVREVIQARREQKILSDWYERAIENAPIEYVR
jgi:peptidyl-prolyl cis-trans isomerase C/foldase protein PrsA